MTENKKDTFHHNNDCLKLEPCITWQSQETQHLPVCTYRHIHFHHCNKVLNKTQISSYLHTYLHFKGYFLGEPQLASFSFQRFLKFLPNASSSPYVRMSFPLSKTVRFKRCIQNNMGCCAVNNILFMIKVCSADRPSCTI